MGRSIQSKFRIKSMYIAAFAVAGLAVGTPLQMVRADVINLAPAAIADVRTGNNGSTGTTIIEIPGNQVVTLEMKNGNATGASNRKAYIRYDVSGLTPSQISSATLTFVTPAESAGHFLAGVTTPEQLQLFGLNDATASFTGTLPSSHTVLGDVAWTAGTGNANTDLAVSGTTVATYLTNVPADTTSTGAYIGNGYNPAESTLIQSLPIPLVADGSTSELPTQTTFTFSGTALTNFLASDTNGTVTFMLYSDTVDTNSEQFLFNTPTLSITTTPEPTSFALLAAGSATLLRRKRRLPTNVTK